MRRAREAASRRRGGARACPGAARWLKAHQGAVNPAKRRAIYERLRAANPDPETELAHATPFELLVAVVLSAQAPTRASTRRRRSCFPRRNTPAAIARLGVEGLIPYISSIGLFRNKAKNVVALSRDPRARPSRRGARGPRSARSAARRGPQDRQRRAQHRVRTADDRGGHAHLPRRQPHRARARARTSRKSSAGSTKFTPDEFKRGAHHWLILHGRYVCVARTPKCPQCIIRDLCEYRHKTPGARRRRRCR